jgi:hypothetical protein
MHSTFRHPRHWDGSRTGTVRPALRLARWPGSRLPVGGQIDICRACGNLLQWFHRADQRPVPLHPREVPAAGIPAAGRWHVHSGIAYPAGDGTAWCRVAHTAVCPSGLPEPAIEQLTALRCVLAARTRRLIDAGALAACPGPQAEPHSCAPVRPVVQILGIRYLAARPLADIRCLARASRTRTRCTGALPDVSYPPGTWRLLPATATAGQLALFAGLDMAVYDLSALPYAEQLRWRAQRCPRHAAALPEMAVSDWEPFDPSVHRQYLHTRLPDQVRPARPTRPCPRS